jgi:hypothetical protein
MFKEEFPLESTLGQPIKDPVVMAGAQDPCANGKGVLGEQESRCGRHD